jgi:hypothetical protein
VKRLGIEAAVIFGLLALGGFLVYHFFVRTIRNERPLGGANVNVTRDFQTETEAAFAIDPSSPRVLVGGTNAPGLDSVSVYTSRDGGATWRHTEGPAGGSGPCARGEPLTAVDDRGRQYLAFLLGHYCGDTLTPYLVVTSRTSAGARWSPLVRVAPAAWKYGYDDGPTLGVDERTGRVYVAWERSLDAAHAPLVVSSSADQGRTWTTPARVSDGLYHPHLASLAVAADGTVYLAGIDARIGVWISRSTDAGRTFSAPRTAAPLLANPSGGCSRALGTPLPHEETACAGPDPTVSVTPDRVFVVYGDVGANGTLDVFVSALDRSLKPLFRGQVNPPETSKTIQFFPASAADVTSGVLWACWYDTTFDPNAHRAWFTCSASRNGRTWGAPVRAAAEPTYTSVLYGIARLQGLGPAVVARDGRAHVFWTDGRIPVDEFDVFTAAIPQRLALSTPSRNADFSGTLVPVQTRTSTSFGVLLRVERRLPPAVASCFTDAGFASPATAEAQSLRLHRGCFPETLR